LNERGHRQAAQAGAALREQGISHIYSSDLSRAADTAHAVAAQTGIAVLQHKGLRERGFGSFEGLTYAEVDERYPQEALRWRQRDPAFAPPGGETLVDFFERAVRTATQLVSAHPGGTVLLVSHGGVLDMLYRAATHQSVQAPRTWQLGNATINRLLWTGESFSLVGWDDDAHLTEESKGALSPK
jgi:2,3-bisphosphoglycerate-dependent phosphoglycerate mutase